MTPALAAELRRLFRNDPAADAYRLRFENYFGARRVRFGAWNPEWHVRLFDRRKFAWNTDEVHEGLRGVEGVQVASLAGTVRHHTVATVGELAVKTERYSELFAARLRRDRRQPAWPKVWLNPGWRFFRDYALRLGVLDGSAGLAIAWEAARYTHLKYRRALPASQPLTRGDWGALATAATLIVALIAATPRGGFRGLWSDLHQSSWPTLKFSLPAFAALDDSDDDDTLGPLPADDDTLT